jgi:ABC-type multidrug transport system fused ATPase/permease subunit
MARTDIAFAEEIKKYGAKDFSACYSCGNCTAVCELTEKNANFPRIFVRYGMLGQKAEILKSKELWMCYACGECSANCPRQAAPGDYMAALRRYSIASYEPTGLTKLIFKSNPFSIFVTLILAVVLGFFLMTLKPDMAISRWIFAWLPYEVIHNMGMVIFSFTGISMVWGLVVMIFKFSKNSDSEKKSKNSLFSSVSNVISELATMKRYRKCDSEEQSYWEKKSAAVKPWFVHWAIMWGFIGLLVATVLDFILKDPATSIWLPSRIIGTIAGILMVYGTSLAIYYRLNKVTRSYENTYLADWLLLIFLWIAGITGFWLEVAVGIEANILLNQIIFLVHTIISMELVLLFAFSKFAHAMYRPLALFFHFQSAK